MTRRANIPPDAGWRTIDTIPIGERVEVLTYSGIVCPARTASWDAPFVRAASRQYPHRRVACFRCDTYGDVAAIAWRPL